jgi:WD40 repeat protein
MTNRLKLVRRIAAIALCVCFTPSVNYSQTVSPQEVVKLRSNIDLKNARWFVFSPVSKLLAVQRSDGSVQIIDLTDGREQAVLPLSDKTTPGLQWTTDGLRLLVVDRKSAAVWDARRGTRLTAPIEIRRGKYFAGLEQITLSPDEKSFLSVREHDTFKSRFLEKDNFRAQVWDVESGRMRFEVKINGLIGGRAQFSPDSKLLLTSSETDNPKLWDVQTGRLFATLKSAESSVLCGRTYAEFSPDGRFVMVQRNQCGVWIWDTSDGVLKNTVWLQKDHIGCALKGFTADGKLFAMAQQRLKGWSIVTSIEVRDCETGELRSTLTATKWEDWPQYVLWSNDGRTFVATSGHNYKGRVWDVSTGRLKATIPMVLTYSRIPFDFGFKDRDELSLHPTLPVITATSNKLVRLWNAETGELMQTLENTGGTAEWSTDGKLLLTSTEDRTSIFVWDVSKILESAISLNQ